METVNAAAAGRPAGDAVSLRGAGRVLFPVLAVLQRLLGLTALATGLVFLPVALATIAGAQLGTQVIGRLGPRPVAAAAFGLAAAGVLLLACLPADASVGADLLPGLLLATAGVGACFVTATSTALGHVEQAGAGLTSGLLNTCRELGGSLGVALVSAIAGASLNSGPLAGRLPVTGFDHAFLALAVVAAASAVATVWLLPPGRPPATDRPVVAH